MNGTSFFLAYNTHRNSGAFSSFPEPRQECSCNGWDTHHCLHFGSEAERDQELRQLRDYYEEELEGRQAAMLNR